MEDMCCAVTDICGQTKGTSSQETLKRLGGSISLLIQKKLSE